MSISFATTLKGEVINDHHLIAEVFREALPYIDFLKGKTLVIKLGGSTLEHQRHVLEDIIWLRSLGVNPVLVHGGGPYINEWLQRLQLPTRFEDGLRVTDKETLKVVKMVLQGQVNQGLVLMASQMGGKVVGLSGTDGGMVKAHQVSENLGFVGKVNAIDPTLIQMCLTQEYIPIIAPLGLDDNGGCLNINADLVAAHIAGALDAEKLIFLSNVSGICREDGSLISQLSEQEALKLIEAGVIHGGMIPKVTACLDALIAVPRVHVVDGRDAHVLLRELFTDNGAGTMIVRNKL